MRKKLINHVELHRCIEKFSFFSIVRLNAALLYFGIGLCLGMFLTNGVFASEGRTSLGTNISILKDFIGKAYPEMVKVFGAPADKTGYAIKDAPTKAWNHKELFDQYPKTAENADIQIMEVTWDDGDFFIMANFHMVRGENRCFIIKRIKKDVRF